MDYAFKNNQEHDRWREARLEINEITPYDEYTGSESQISRVRRVLKIVKDANVATIWRRDELIRDFLSKQHYNKSHGVDTWNERCDICGVVCDEGSLTYRPHGLIHFILRNATCTPGNLCYCIKLKTLELRQHIIGMCPDGNYTWKSEYYKPSFYITPLGAAM
jgi:hypothetical protein